MTSHSTDTDSSTDTPQAFSVVPGVALWVVVICALLYGIVKTVDTAAALFTGG